MSEINEASLKSEINDLKDKKEVSSDKHEECYFVLHTKEKKLGYA